MTKLVLDNDRIRFTFRKTLAASMFSSVASPEKLNATIQIRLTEEHKENLDKDLPLLAKQLKKQTGIIINLSDFLRLVLEDLHEKILSEETIIWPPRLETSVKSSKERKAKYAPSSRNTSLQDEPTQA